MSSLAITSIAKSWTRFVGACEENVVRLGEQRIHVGKAPENDEEASPQVGWEVRRMQWPWCSSSRKKG